MSYKIVKNGNQFEIHELESQLIVDVFNDHGKASERYRFLKRGGNFAGWTPAFFLISVKNLVKEVENG